MLRVDIAGDSLRVTFPFSRVLVKALRALPVAHHDGEAWVIPVEETPALLEAIDGRPVMWSGDISLLPRPVSGSPVENPLDGVEDTLAHGPGFVTEPYDHQRIALVHLLKEGRSGFALFMEMGTGKTKVIIDWMRFAPLGGFPMTHIVVCPKALLYTWAREIEVHSNAADRLVPIVLDGTMKSRRAKIDTTPPGGGVVIVNYDVLKTLRKDLTFLDADSITFDESTRVKNPRAKVTKAAWKLADTIPHRWLLTGTPFTQSPLDAYAQFRIVSVDIFGHKSFFSFRNEFAKTMTSDPMKPAWMRAAIVGYKNLPRLKSRIEPHSYRVLKEDCLDLPPKLPPVRYDFDLSPSERAAYKAMQDDGLVTIGEATSMAPLVITQLIRLKQIASGFVGDEDGKLHQLTEGPSSRMKVLADVLGTLWEENPDRNIIIWAHFREEIKQICETIHTLDDHRKWVAYHGDVRAKARMEAIDWFQAAKGAVFIGQIATGGMGITLTSADAVVYYSNTFSLGDRLQSEDRAHRIGQTRPVAYVDLVGRDTIDETIIEALRAKKNVADFLTGDAMRRLFNG